MEIPDSLECKRAILEYWSLVEFFSPYIIENMLDPKLNYQKIYAGTPLPWLNEEIIEEIDPATPFAKGYHLYLGLFSMEETADRARHTFAEQLSDWQSINWRSCATASSTTCFARLTVTTHGIPLFGTLTLSTLPWAHGRLLNGQEKSLTIEHYWKSVNRLILSLREEFSAELPTKLMKKPNISARYLDVETLSKLVDHLYAWAGYKPLGYPLALIEPLHGDNKTAAKDPQLKEGRDVPILNSFYIQDLESAAISLPTQKGNPIDLYLSEDVERRILLESEEGAKTILDTVRPEKIPPGRWPDRHQQSLMQQFAINASFDQTIFSINGPPGTGKTSLLKEIIAGNIVARAVALSKFEIAGEAFIGRQTLNFESSDPVYISELDPSLLGFEMVVVSSNNTAVQNLSKELPLRSQLNPLFEKASYLETVAAKALGSKEKEAWGLISATLGNLENCRQFVDKVFFSISEEKGKTTIWEWVDGYSGPSFSEAKSAFLTIKGRFEHLLDELENLASLHDEIRGESVEAHCAMELEELQKCEEESSRLEQAISIRLLEEIEVKERLILLQERETLWKQERPGILVRLTDRKAFKAWSEKLRYFRNERLAAIDELHKYKAQVKDLRRELLEQNNIELEKNLLDQALLFYTYQELREAHPTARLPNSLKELDEREAHTGSYYQTNELNETRSNLFLAAMTLHEAWLAETARVKGGFRGNLRAISNILQGKSPTTAVDTRLAWQSVFLLLPVISSTFASIGRLFRHLEPGMLGWVLIDEAGQAIPQAAVGAIWRANKVLSIGDPFQLEPICAVPAEVIDGMAKSKLNDNTLSWAPSQVSVQNLMDRVSIFGSKRTILEENYWLGSPLRVHRRCLEPMFTIANTIAYEGNMLQATEVKEISLPASCWWDVRGRATNRQVVPDQVAALLQLLMSSFAIMDTPDLFVISPFREVVSEIQQSLLEAKTIKKLFEQKFPSTPLLQWVKQAVGTVHTFQGKQAAAVFLVLGADKSTFGAIEWASAKPNLLNVAVTRAQSRFYMIGDYDLWRNRPYFEVAAKKLAPCRLETLQ